MKHHSPSGERQDESAPRMGEPGWYPDHTAERRADFRRTTASERVLEAIELSEVATTLSAAARRARTRAAEEPAASAAVDRLDARALLRTLADQNVAFVVIGGLAIAAHGYPRATRTVEIVPDAGGENRRRLLEALQTLDAQPIEVGDFRPEELPVPFAPEGLGEGGNWALRTRAGRIDVLQWLAGVEGYGQLRAGAIEVELPEVGPVLVAGYDDLVAMKRAAGRLVDEVDLEELERVRRKDSRPASSGPERPALAQAG